MQIWNQVNKTNSGLKKEEFLSYCCENIRKEILTKINGILLLLRPTLSRPLDKQIEFIQSKYSDE